MAVIKGDRGCLLVVLKELWQTEDITKGQIQTSVPHGKKGERWIP